MIRVSGLCWIGSKVFLQDEQSVVLGPERARGLSGRWLACLEAEWQMRPTDRMIDVGREQRAGPPTRSATQHYYSRQVSECGCKDGGHACLLQPATGSSRIDGSDGGGGGWPACDRLSNHACGSWQLGLNFLGYINVVSMLHSMPGSSSSPLHSPPLQSLYLTWSPVPGGGASNPGWAPVRTVAELAPLFAAVSAAHPTRGCCHDDSVRQTKTRKNSANINAQFTTTLRVQTSFIRQANLLGQTRLLA